MAKISIATGSLSLQEHCQVCPTSCCFSRYIFTTEANRNEITASGAPDHFEEVILPEGKFYVINPVNTYCAYFDKGCTIQENKPLTCKTYPALGEYYGDRPQDINMIRDTRGCPSAHKVTQEYLDNAKPLMIQYRTAFPMSLREKIKDGYRDQIHLPRKNRLLEEQKNKP